MPAIVVSTTDQVEDVKSALGSKGNVTVNDESGNEIAQIEKIEEDKEVNEEDTEKDKEDSAASEDDKPSDDKNAEDSADSGEEEEKSGKKAQRKIDKLTKELNELRQQLEVKPQQPQQDDKAKPAAPVAEEAEPKAEDYDTQADYLKALSKWAAKEARKETKAEEAKQAAVDKQNQVVAGWKKQVETAKSKYKDWNDVMDDTVIGNTAARMLVETQDGAELAYYIGKHPEEAKQFANMTSEREVAMALGVIRAAVKASVKPDAKTKAAAPTGGKGSTKPKPITPISGSAPSGTVKAPKDMNYQEYKLHRESQLKRRAA